MDEHITALQPTAYGRLSLSLLETEQLAQSMADHVELEFEAALAEETVEAPAFPGDLQTDMEALRKGSLFVVEWMDVATKKRIGWIRVSEKGFTHQVQWAAEGVQQFDVLTESLWQALMKGDWL